MAFRRVPGGDAIGVELIVGITLEEFVDGIAVGVRGENAVGIELVVEFIEGLPSDSRDSRALTWPSSSSMKAMNLFLTSTGWAMNSPSVTGVLWGLERFTSV
jgi:hypothetical protein